MKKFTKVNIEVSNICNLQCSFCPEVIRSPKIMEISLFKKIISQVAPLTEQVCFHLMGDPLVHPKLFEMMEICEEFKVKIFLVTNGVLLQDKKFHLLLHPALRQVNFSLHSFNDNYPERDPTAYLEKIFIYTRLAFVERPDLYINYRLWNLQDPRGAADSNKVTLQKIASHFEVNIDASLDVRQRKSLNLINKLYLHFDTEFSWPEMHLPILGKKGTCYGLSNHFGILVDGTVVPCCLDKEGSIPLGRIQDQDITEILNNEKSQSILKGFREGNLVESLCQRCQYIERFQ